MSRFVFKMPDLGEGTVDAEIVAWRVKPGDNVTEDEVIAEVMTEKAVVELPAPVTGKVISVAGAAGDRVPVGAELIAFETDSAAAEVDKEQAPATKAPARSDKTEQAAVEQPVAVRKGRVLTSPATRRKAREAGIDLASIDGSGPHGRITRQDIDALIAGARPSSSPRTAATADLPRSVQNKPLRDEVEEIKVIGLRRVIAQRMSDAKRNIPHFAYVEEVDVTELEELRRYLNSKRAAAADQLTYLPFLVIALTRALQEFPDCNALYDSERGVIMRYRAVHAGIATQTPDGLKVPVVRNAQDKGLWELSDEIRRVSEAARTNKATREELGGSTITVTSLGKLGGIVSTPIINAPEVAIIGVNRAVERPMVRGGAIAIRRMMNLSSSFDHRFVDGHVAASLVQAVKESLEHPATLFIPD
jgi:2-oxoisovalerate dehydrogenase E2 component (dihydrolipoyl transacylase)